MARTKRVFILKIITKGYNWTSCQFAIKRFFCSFLILLHFNYKIRNRNEEEIIMKKWNIDVEMRGESLFCSKLYSTVPKKNKSNIFIKSVEKLVQHHSKIGNKRKKLYICTKKCSGCWEICVGGRRKCSARGTFKIAFFFNM